MNMGIETPAAKLRREKLAKEQATAAAVADMGPPAISYAAAIRIPMVAQYAVAFGFFKVRIDVYAVDSIHEHWNPSCF